MGAGILSKTKNVVSIQPFINFLEFERISKDNKAKITDKCIGNNTIILHGPLKIMVDAGIFDSAKIIGVMSFGDHYYNYDQIIENIYIGFNRKLNHQTLYNLISISSIKNDQLAVSIYTYLLELLYQKSLKVMDLNANSIYIDKIICDAGDYFLKLKSKY